ncbi:hypothetical protein HY745_15220 [Candidatus Desantisbacteria bacterium]|nr:hypothetical protein [Candidatus Desantisbacteria bacterium]
MPVVKTLDDIMRNLETLENYRQSTDNAERKFYKGLLRRGKWFVVYECRYHILIGPSRFVGYANNSKKVHENNTYKDGRETNPAIEVAINALVAKNVTYSDVDEKFGILCTREGITPQGSKKKVLVREL